NFGDRPAEVARILKRWIRLSSSWRGDERRIAEFLRQRDVETEKCVGCRTQKNSPAPRVDAAGGRDKLVRDSRGRPAREVGREFDGIGDIRNAGGTRIGEVPLRSHHG